MEAGDAVTYAKTRGTQHVEPDRRNAKGVAVALENIDGEPCARVVWEWSNVGFWVPTHLLQTLNTEDARQE